MKAQLPAALNKKSPNQMKPMHASQKDAFSSQFDFAPKQNQATKTLIETPLQQSAIGLAY